MIFDFLTIKAVPRWMCIAGGGTGRGRAIGRGIPANPAARSPADSLPLPGEGRLTPLHGTARLRGLRQSELADRKYDAPERESLQAGCREIPAGCRDPTPPPFREFHSILTPFSFQLPQVRPCEESAWANSSS